MEHQARAKESSDSRADSTPQTGGRNNPAGTASQTEGPAMNIQLGSTFDSTSDFFEIGLMAAASPEFADNMIRALLAGGADFSIARESTAALRPSSATQGAAG
jgi:hypothetical protein